MNSAWRVQGNEEHSKRNQVPGSVSTARYPFQSTKASDRSITCEEETWEPSEMDGKINIAITHLANRSSVTVYHSV